MIQKRLYERYSLLPWTHQLGNLASTLARIASRVHEPRHDDLVDSLLREAATFIEWSAPHVPAGLLIDLAAMQREILAWHRIWPHDVVRPIIALYARDASDRLLVKAGLVGPSG
jgi:hypothetical protein